MKREPWYRHVAGGQGKTSEDVNSLVDSLIIVILCCLAVLLLLIAFA